MHLDAWKPGMAALTFRIGERAVVKCRYRALICTTPYGEMPSDLKGLRLPFRNWPDDIDVLNIPSCPLTATFPRLHTHDYALCYVMNRYRRSVIEVAGKGFADFLLSTFSAKTRSTLRRKLRRFESHCGGTIDCRSYGRPEEISEFLTIATDLSAKTYQERLLQKGLPRSAAFTRNALERATRDCVRGYLLFAGPTPVAYMYCPIENGTMLYEHVGYDPDYRIFSVGTILLYLVLEQLFADRLVGMFDFTEGEGEHKEFWATKFLNCGDILLFPPILKARFVVGLHTGYEHAHRMSTQLLSGWASRHD